MEEEAVPLALKCVACTPWAAVKGWAALNILFCRKLEHGAGRPVITKIRLALEQYLGRISIPNNKLRFAANFIYHTFSGSEITIPPSIHTPSFNQSLALGLILPLLLSYQKYQSIHPILCNG